MAYKWVKTMAVVGVNTTFNFQKALKRYEWVRYEDEEQTYRFSYLLQIAWTLAGSLWFCVWAFLLKKMTMKSYSNCERESERERHVRR